MPFRDKLKRALGTNSEQSDSSSPTKTTTEKKDDDIYYKPHEIPPSRFRGPVTKEHKARLEAFSFVNNWRRRSRQSQVSPRGSQVPSRNNSTVSPTGQRISKSGSQPRPDQVEEAKDDDGNVANVGGSRGHSKENHQKELDAPEGNISPGGKDHGNSNDSKPFTDDELSDAFKKANLEDSNETKTEA